MNKKTLLRTTIWGAVVALPIAIVGASSANAVPYAYASNVDTGFAITTAGGAPAGNYVISSGTFSSTNTTTTNGLSAPFQQNVGFTSTVPAPGSASAAQAYNGAGAPPPKNTTTEYLNNPSGDAVRADSNDTGFAGQGSNVAEGRIIGQPAFGSATGSGSIGSTTLVLIVNNPTALNVSFTDSIGYEIATSALVGEEADATLSSSVAIVNSQGQKVYNFAPSGSPNSSTTGGTTNSDPFSLNFSVSSTVGNPLDSGLVTNSGLFSSTTNLLAVGTYTIQIGQAAKVNLTVGVPVPEPTSIALLGAGLIGLGAFRRSPKKRA